MQNKLVVFDMDGTLIDSMSVWKNEGLKLLQNYNITNYDMIMKKFEIMSASQIAKYLTENKVVPASYDELTKLWCSKMLDRYQKDIKLKPYVIEVLEKYKSEGYTICIATGTPKDLAIEVLTRLKVKKYFKEIFDEGVIGMHKAEYNFFAKVIEKMGFKPENTIVIEDAIFAVKSAHSIGAYTIAVYDEVSKDLEEEISNFADQYIHSFKELL